MAINYKTYDFPPVHIRSQLFHVPGMAADGGITSGGARITSPEPGGFAVLEVQPSLSVQEWSAPWMSWLMSKLNGEVFKIQLTKTPQLCQINHEDLLWDDDLTWDGDIPWSDEGDITFFGSHLEGSNTVAIDFPAELASKLRVGHVIGHKLNSYIIDEIEPDGSIAVLTIKPPLRTDASTSDSVLLRPYFLGQIANGPEIRAAYDANMVGHVQLGKIIFNEVNLPYE